MFHPTHYLIASNNGQETPVCLVPTKRNGWYEVRTALDWFAGESTIQYHGQQGLQSQGVTLNDYSIVPIKAAAPTTPDRLTTAPASATNGHHRPSQLTEQFYSGREICRRFQCGDQLLKKMRQSAEFTEWSQTRDPEGMAWEYRHDKYYPLVSEPEVKSEIKSEIKPKLKPEPDASPQSSTLSEQVYSVRQMCKRFKCGDKLLQRMRESADFTDWSRSRDPEGVPWEYREGKYYPLTTASEPVLKQFSPSLTERPYSVRELCRRFKCGDKLLQRMRNSTEFAQWSHERDPDNVVWEYRSGKYYPLLA
ncbi:MAG: hypothetical protein F6K19_49490 [Cyanothece sp. SIO1E1]|nr:hypothetical protein [Cyanothece sp. SIO1E1]